MATASPRRWAAFVDAVNPRIVMTAQPVPGGSHWTYMDVDEERSTANVTIWLGNDGQPAHIEAEGGDDLRALEAQISDAVYVSDTSVVGSPTLYALPNNPGWIWWHPDLLVSRDTPEDLPDDFMEALAQVRENEERRARRPR